MELNLTEKVEIIYFTPEDQSRRCVLFPRQWSGATNNIILNIKYKNTRGSNS